MTLFFPNNIHLTFSLSHLSFYSLSSSLPLAHSLSSPIMSVYASYCSADWLQECCGAQIDPLSMAFLGKCLLYL